ncbi:MAG: TIGR01906 family membrane protein [Chloroflexota bacterium]|jgi:integral membrane protein (TIGR01906 family)
MKTLRSIILYLLIPAVTLFLMMTAIRLLIQPLFVTIEYSMPGFPPDPYGFTKEERLHWATLSVNYLVNDADISFLGDLRFADGSPVFNQRELIHMFDVKVLVQLMIRAWIGLGVFIFLSGVWAWRAGWLAEFWLAISRAGWATLAVVALILLGVAISFSALFTGFHKIFFEGDSWLFLHSDTLIRLFPLRFWQDAFILMGVLTIIGGLLAALLGKRLARNALAKK